MSDNGGGEEGNDIAFLKEAIVSLSSSSLALPMLLAVAGTAVCTLLLLSYWPVGKDPNVPAVHVLFAARTLVQAMVTIAALRILNGSPRPPWKPDGSFWAFILIVLMSFPIAMLAASIMSPAAGLSSWLAFQFLCLALGAPLLPWAVAIAVERPLAWRPARYFRRLKAWLPPILLWSFTIVAPATLVYQILEGELLTPADREMWLVLPDSILSVSITFFMLALASVAYGRAERA